MGYGGWGTGQQLEALKLEGFSYRPDLIINQFTSNDLSDNQFYEADSNRRSKPFSYRLVNGKVVRQVEEIASGSLGFKDLVRNQLQGSEILKRMYAVYLTWAMREIPIKEYEYDQSHLGHGLKYIVGENQLKHLKVVLGDDVHTAFAPLSGQSISPARIKEIISDGNFGEESAAIYRILEKRWFKEYWDPDNYVGKPSGTGEGLGTGWKLYFGILGLMKEACDQKYVPLAVFCEEDTESRRWSESWYMSPKSEDPSVAGTKHFRIIERFAKQKGIAIIPQSRPYFRARNDPHPNADGHQNMAMDIRDFILAEFRDE